jgi:hypothetical protein
MTEIENDEMHSAPRSEVSRIARFVVTGWASYLQSWDPSSYVSSYAL